MLAFKVEGEGGKEGGKKVKERDWRE